LAALESIREAHPASKGKLGYQYLDLGDLTTVKPAVEEFLKLEDRLDVLWNNAGVMTPPAGCKTTQVRIVTRRFTLLRDIFWLGLVDYVGKTNY
jgi:NAD(P)-dependent dehydrogenase (short-subunit alcohol dehydrogenase family)